MREILKNFINRKTVKNGIWMYLLQFFNTVIPLFTLPYVTRILGTYNYGLFSIALNVVVYLQVIVEYGFGMSATRKVVIDNREDSINRLFSNVILARLLLLTICLFFTALYTFVRRDKPELCYSLILLDICLVGYCVQMNWLFQGLQEMKYISIINVVARTISVLLIFLFVKNNSDLFVYCVLYSISPLLSGIIGLLIAVKRFKVKKIKVSIKDVFIELKEGWYVFTTQLSSKVFGAIGITILSFYASEQDIGIYSAIQKITNLLLLCWLPISQVLYPVSSQHFQSGFKQGIDYIKKTRRYILPIFICIAVLICFFAKLIVSIAFGTEYSEKYYWLIPLLAWVVVAIENNFLGIQTLLGSGHDVEYSKCFNISVVGTIMINFILIATFGCNGASIAPLISELILFALLKKQVVFITNQESP